MPQRLSLALLSLLLLLVACTQPADPTPPPMPTDTPEAAATTPTPPAPGDLWQTIQDRGRMVVGVSADYPPFEYYTDEFIIDGFDIALIRDIAAELGVSVQFKDMAFDGLGGALQLGQIDTAISAISYTPERDQQFDFSNTYFVSADAILALESAELGPITDVAQLAPLRVGVQSGTIFEDWVRDELIDTELMPQANLFVYQELTTADRDLIDGRIDVVVLDALPAERALETFGELEIVGRDLNRERLAIALPSGETTLQDRLNDALISLQESGRVNDLIEEYIGLDEDEILPIPPTEPDEPEGITPEPDGCIDGMAFVGDINYDDQDMTNPPALQPGESFQKGWRLRNVGTCTWDDRYGLVYVGGSSPAARMNGVPVDIQGAVPPGQTVDVYADLVAPLTPGTYQGFWSMRSPSGLLFGERVWVGITVVGNPTPTPLPTQTPAPNIEFSADRTAINAGECATLTWRVENVSAVYLYELGQPWQNFPVQGSGSRAVCPTETTTYELRVVNNDGSVTLRQIRIDVRPVANAPVIDFFNANPPVIQAGHCTQLGWQVRGTVSNVALTRDGETIWASAPVSGRLEECPREAKSYEYVLTASGPGGTSRSTVYVTVNAAVNTPTPTPVPTSTPAPLPPQIYSFSVRPNQIVAGECVVITWNTGGGTTYVRILRDGVTLLDGAPLAGGEQDCLTRAGTYNYGVEVRSSSGATDFRDQQVTVNDAPVENPLANTSWTLTGMFNDGMPSPIIPGTTVSASFSADGRVSGSSGCNTYGATYTVSGAQIAITPPSATNTSCGTPEGVMAQEAAYLATLSDAAGFEINGPTLSIRNSAGQTILTYQAAPQPR